jgi:hypothetical protein
VAPVNVSGIIVEAAGRRVVFTVWQAARENSPKWAGFLETK